MFHKLEEFYGPFAVALVAIMTLSVTYEVYGRIDLNRIVDPFAEGVVVAGLLGAILYSVIRLVLEGFPLNKSEGDRGEDNLERIAGSSFGPDEIKVMTEAYEGALIDLAIDYRDEPTTRLIAKSIVNVAATGERNPVIVKERAIRALGVRRPSAA